MYIYIHIYIYIYTPVVYTPWLGHAWFLSGAPRSQHRAHAIKSRTFFEYLSLSRLGRLALIIDPPPYKKTGGQ